MSLAKTLQKMASRGHVWLYRKTGGRVFTMGHRVVIVTTTGAKTHQPRTSPLVAFPRGEGWVVIAAAGREHSPGWYHNMVANPDVVVERATEVRRMVARQAVGIERDAIWREVVEEEPAYDSFQRKSERTIPVMILESAPIQPSTA